MSRINHVPDVYKNQMINNIQDLQYHISRKWQQTHITTLAWNGLLLMLRLSRRKPTNKNPSSYKVKTTRPYSPKGNNKERKKPKYGEIKKKKIVTETKWKDI